MTDKEAKEQFEAKVRKRVESLRKTFTPLTERLAPGDEPAPVFAPYVDPDKS